MAHSLSLLRIRLFHWWLKLTHRSHKVWNFKPLLRAEFAGEDFFAQAYFLVKAGYHNAGVAMARFAVEKQLLRLVLVTARWQDCRSKTLGNLISYLHNTTEVLGKGDMKSLNKFNKLASKCIHSTKVDAVTAYNIVNQATRLRPRIHDMFARALGAETCTEPVVMTAELAVAL
jgi:hypothetical protein